MALLNRLLLLQRIKPRTVVTEPTELCRYRYEPLHTDIQFTAADTWPLFRFVCVCVFPSSRQQNLSCYQAHSFERCHSDVEHTLWLLNDLPEDEPCHRNTQDNASFKYYRQHELSTNRLSLSACAVITCTRHTNSHRFKKTTKKMVREEELGVYRKYINYFHF